MAATSSIFAAEYGLTVDELTGRYDKKLTAQAAKSCQRFADLEIWRASLKEQLDKSEAWRGQVKQQIDILETAQDGLQQKLKEAGWRDAAIATRVGILEEQHSALNEHLAAVYRSNSWRLTAPLRSAGRFVRWLVSGTAAWVTFRPGSRPRRTARWIANGIVRRALARPWLARHARTFLGNFPGLERRLRAMVKADRRSLQNENTNWRPHFEPEGAQRIYQRLVIAREHALRKIP